MIVVTGLDLETTGLKQEDGHRIIEVGLTVYKMEDDLSFQKVGKTYLQRINPLRPIDKGAQLVHGISLDDVRGAPEWEQIAPKISKILGATHLLVAHNAAFDVPFIALELVRAGLPIPSLEVFCTMENGRSCTAMGKLPNLGELCWSFGVDYDPDAAHAADYDIERTMECFIRGVQNGRFQIPSSLLTQQNGEIAA